HRCQNYNDLSNGGSCQRCIDICPNIALKISGEEKSVEQVLSVVAQDQVFYQTSGGGITLGGGDPLMQHSFAQALLKKCRESGISTAIETAANVDWKIIEDTISDLDWIFVDLKHMNGEQHQKYTGVHNRLILKNIERLLDPNVVATSSVSVVIRIPLIPGFNDCESNIANTAKFLYQINKNHNLKYLELLPYHQWGVVKYQQLGMNYHGPSDTSADESADAPPGTPPYNNTNTAEELAEIFKKNSLNTIEVKFS
ncbi:MAG: glycyl-radical enzyme activating protein, partial [Oligoflexia bacterium]|nr:glycyl-radical enzyme activating protein [Oligoflexia bacterium]